MKMNEYVSKAVAAVLRGLANFDKPVLGLCGGRSVTEIYEELAKEDLSNVEIFLVDDRKDGSNYDLVMKIFGKCHKFESVEQYSNLLDKFGGRINVAVFSSGEDGHIGGLFPRRSVLLKGRYISMKDAPKKPAERMSMSTEMVTEVNVAVLLFYGDAKKEAFERFIDPELAIEDCPAKLIALCPVKTVVTLFDTF